MTWPLIAGAGGKDGGEGASEAPDNLNHLALAQFVDLLSEGEIEGFATPSKLGYTRGSTEWNNALMKDVYYDRTRLLRVSADDTNPADGDFNFTDVTLYTRYGTQDQTFIGGGFDAIEDETQVGAVVRWQEPITRTILKEGADAVRVTLTWQSLQKVEDDGDIVEHDVQIQIQVQYNGGGFQVVRDDLVAGRTGDQYQKDYVIPLSGDDPIDVRVVRMEEDSDSVRRIDEFTWTSYTAIIYQKLSYPNSAYVATQISAENFGSIPQRSYRIRGIKVRIPSNATVNRDNGRLVYSGLWDGTFQAATWCACPVWILWDLLTSTRYGTGDFITDAVLDKWAFYEASVYANELVPTGLDCPVCEPRFSIGVNIQTETEVYKLIQDLASVFRAITYWSAGAIAINQDRPQEPSALFTLANVLEGGFNYETSSLKARATAVVVSWLNLDTQELDVEYVEDTAAIAKWGVVKKSVTAFATTSRSQARRVGEWILYSDNYETEVVTFQCGMDHGASLRPGQVIQIADPVQGGNRHAGRISSATTTTVTVDSASGLTGSETTLAVTLPDLRVEIRNISSIVGNVITVGTAFSTAPTVGGTWMTGLDVDGIVEECAPCTNEAPCGSIVEGVFWQVGYPNSTGGNSMGTIDSAGRYHWMLETQLTPAGNGLAYIQCYPWTDITDNGLLFNLQFIDSDGFGQNGNADPNFSFAIGDSVYHFFNSNNGAGTSRIYLVEIEPSTGSVIRYATYDRSTNNTRSGKVEEVRYVEEENAIYVQIYHPNSVFPADGLLKINMGDLTLAWGMSWNDGGLNGFVLVDTYVLMSENDASGSDPHCYHLLSRSTGAYDSGSYQYQYENPANPGAWVTIEPANAKETVTDNNGDWYINSPGFLMKISGSTLLPVWLTSYTNYLDDMTGFTIGTNQEGLYFDEATNSLVLIQDGGSNSSSGRRSFPLRLSTEDGSILADPLDPGADATYSPSNKVNRTIAPGNAIFQQNGVYAWRFPAQITNPGPVDVTRYPSLSTISVGTRARGQATFLSRDLGWGIRRVGGPAQSWLATAYAKSSNSGDLTTQAATINWPAIPSAMGDRWYLGGL